MVHNMTIAFRWFSVLVLSILVAGCFDAKQSGAKHIVLVGPPASGKGTQAAFLSQKLNVPSISTGDLLRAEVKQQSELGLSIAQTMQAGELVDDETVVAVLKQRLSQDDTQNGFILDGFPRTVNQAKLLAQAGVTIDTVVEIDVSDNMVKTRITGRRVHPGSGRTYHEVYNPPKVAGKDDVTGEPLIQRADDTLKVITERLKTYHEQTAPVLDFYRNLEPKINMVSVNGALGIENIQQTLLKELK